MQKTMKDHKKKALDMFRAFSMKSLKSDHKQELKQSSRNVRQGLGDRRSFESSSTSDSTFSTNSASNSITSTCGTYGTYEKIKPELPNDWELRYDPVLSEYYYVNKKEGVVQFDSPLEVVQHIDT